LSRSNGRWSPLSMALRCVVSHAAPRWRAARPGRCPGVGAAHGGCYRALRLEQLLSVARTAEHVNPSLSDLRYRAPVRVAGGVLSADRPALRLSVTTSPSGPGAPELVRRRLLRCVYGHGEPFRLTALYPATTAPPRGARASTGARDGSRGARAGFLAAAGGTLREDDHSGGV
jgi:hypothetical protein